MAKLSLFSLRSSRTSLLICLGQQSWIDFGRFGENFTFSMLKPIFVLTESSVVRLVIVKDSALARKFPELLKPKFSGASSLNKFVGRTFLVTFQFHVARLFPGRRRKGDVHEALHRWGDHFGINLQILSLDTAVDAELGDLHRSSWSWKQLLQCYQRGRVAASIVGSPCETFSEARHMEPPNHESSRAWPRPLRSSERLFGLNALTLREYRQLHQGIQFFLQRVLALVFHLCNGGMLISEHPAPPTDPSRASIWTTGIMKLLRRHPDIHLHVFPQYLWEASVVKPTGLLALRLPNFRRTMFSRAKLTCPKPSAVAIGKHQDGSFRTSAHKKYPPRFCDALAFSIVSQIKASFEEGSVRTAQGGPTEVSPR